MRHWLLILFSLASINSFCQHGKIVGHITSHDPYTELKYVTVELRQKDTVITGAIPDENGRFSLERIGKGTYSLAIRQIGYRTAITEGLNITADTVITLDLVYPPPCPFTTSKKPVCIDGHTDHIIPIIYGLPSKGTLKKSKKGIVHLGGCEITNCNPYFYCTIHQKEL